MRTLSADNLYKGDDLYVELLITNRSNRKTQLLEVDNIHRNEIKKWAKSVDLGGQEKALG